MELMLHAPESAQHSHMPTAKIIIPQQSGQLAGPCTTTSGLHLLLCAHPSASLASNATGALSWSHHPCVDVLVCSRLHKRPWTSLHGFLRGTHTGQGTQNQEFNLLVTEAKAGTT